MKRRTRGSARRERRLEALISYTLLTLSAAFALLPVIWMFSTSLKSEAEALSLPVRWIPRHPTLSAYVEMWTLKPFGTYFYNSIVVSGITALISTVLGALAGYGFSRFRFRGRISLRAVGMALQMRERGGQVLSRWQRLGLDLGLGIGIASGYVTVGAIGGERRLEYAAVGPPVNLAARLCALADSGEILADQRTVGLSSENGHAYRFDKRDPVTLKGFTRPVTVFSVGA